MQERMNRSTLIWAAALLAVLDVGVHLRRSLIPNGNPFASPLHQQFFLYCVVAIVLVGTTLTGPMWLKGRAWLASAGLMAWEAGAIIVWLLSYHAPNPPRRRAG